MGLVLLSQFQMAYIGQVRPREERILNRLELFLEWSALTVILSTVWFTEWLPDEETKYAFAWIPIGLIIGSMLISLCFIFYFGFRTLYLVGYKYYYLLKWKLCSNSSSVKRRRQLNALKAKEAEELEKSR